MTQYVIVIDKTDDPAIGKEVMEEYSSSSTALAAAQAYANQGYTSAFYTRTSTITPGTPVITPG